MMTPSKPKKTIAKFKKGKGGQKLLDGSISLEGKKAPRAKIEKTEVRKPREGYSFYGKAKVELLDPLPFVNPGPNFGLEPEEIFELYWSAMHKVNGQMSDYDGLKPGSKEFDDMSEARGELYHKWMKENKRPAMHSPEREARIKDHRKQQKERFAEIVGATVTGIWFSDNLLTFETDRGLYSYFTNGSYGSSYFADFHGVKHLYENGPIIAIEEIDLHPSDDAYLPPDAKGPREGDAVAVYGVRITTMHPVFHEVSSVFSFRNESNGYYGSEIFRQSDYGQGKESEKKWLDYISPEQVRLTEDKPGD